MKLIGSPQQADPGIELTHWCPGPVGCGFGPGAPGEWWAVFQVRGAGDVWWLLEGSEAEMLAWWQEIVRCWCSSQVQHGQLSEL